MIRSLNKIYHGTLNEYINVLRDHVNRIMQIRKRAKTQTSEEKKNSEWKMLIMQSTTTDDCKITETVQIIKLKCFVFK